ncbi:restriction endonuclease subunit S [Sphingobacterium endophyticum]|uniref:restriction endonuclease subunit S n=1 Tax=Sphingobacterium endophyticum TaxID=2546448 RepID=UPI0012E24BB5|nr:restriction endonuclease subunit S [Sphingobacterium endophyticum]
MINWNQTSIGEFINFNPSESLPKGVEAKKVPMERLGTFERKIKGFELSPYNSGPKFKNGDTLVAKITPCLENGKTAYVDILNEGEIAFGSSEFIVLRENEKSDSKFIYYLARSPLFRERAISCMEGTSGRKRVNEGALKRQEILVPNVLTQKKIASVLSALDDKIELNNRINTELEQMSKTLYDYWFVQFDFPNEAGKPYKSSGGKMVYNNVLKREIPEGWDHEKIADLGTIIGGSTPSKLTKSNFAPKGMPWITPKDLSVNIGKKFITRGEIDVTELGMKEASLKILPAGSVLMSSRAPVGYLSINRVDCTTNQGFKSIVCDKTYSCEYVYYVLNRYMPVIEANATGSTFKEISASVFKSINILKPNHQIVEMFIKVIKPIFDNQNNLEQQNQELAQLRDWLLPMLMNGQVKVGDNYNIESDAVSIAAEPDVSYGSTEPLDIPTNKKGFARQVLAGKVVSVFKDDPNFSNIKFQKVQFLAEHIIEADLNQNYYYQAAGPYDNAFMKSINGHFKTQKWFDSQNQRFVTLTKEEKIEGYYQGYFARGQDRLDRLFNLLYRTTEAEAEIIATMYAVWNNRIIQGTSITDNELIEDFYQWSDRKQQYTKDQILVGLNWLRDNNLEPKGFGNLIKKAKNTK